MVCVKVCARMEINIYKPIQSTDTLKHSGGTKVMSSKQLHGGRFNYVLVADKHSFAHFCGNICITLENWVR